MPFKKKEEKDKLSAHLSCTITAGDYQTLKKLQKSSDKKTMNHYLRFIIESWLEEDRYTKSTH